MPGNFEYVENNFIGLSKFLTLGKKDSQKFEGFKIGYVQSSNLRVAKDPWHPWNLWRNIKWKRSLKLSLKYHYFDIPSKISKNPCEIFLLESLFVECIPLELNNIHPQTMPLELNDIHPQVKFTFECMVDNQIPFLDCMVMRGGNSLEAKFEKQ